MKIIDIVEKLRPSSWAYIDVGFRQGREAVLRQYKQQFEPYEEEPSQPIDDSLAFWQDAIKDLRKRAAPYDVPEDYIFFLEHYGGLAIDGAKLYFSIHGIGPMVETWYGYMNSGDHVLLESTQLGWLSLGDLVFRGSHKYSNQRVLFFLDLAGTIQKFSVIGIGPWDGVTPRASSVLNDIHAHSGLWKILATSFTEFLEQAAETRGEFRYT